MRLEKGVEPEKGCLKKHEDIARVVEEEFTKRGYVTQRNVKFSEEHFVGDYDVVAVKENYRHNVEVKSNKHRIADLKAVYQLWKCDRHSDLYEPQDRVFNWYAHSSEDDDGVVLTRVPRHSLMEKIRKGEYLDS